MELLWLLTELLRFCLCSALASEWLHTPERVVFYWRRASASTAPCTSRRTCCLLDVLPYALCWSLRPVSAPNLRQKSSRRVKAKSQFSSRPSQMSILAQKRRALSVRFRSEREQTSAISRNLAGKPRLARGLDFLSVPCSLDSGKVEDPQWSETCSISQSNIVRNPQWCTRT